MKLLILLLILPLYSYSQKPLKIKMQPRWRKEIALMPGDSGYKPDEAYMIYESEGDLPEWNLPESDTTKVIMLVSDTSNQNGFRSSRCWWMEGYETMCSRLEKLPNSRCLDKDDKPTTECYIEIIETCYLDQSKIPLKKSIIVWMSKEVK